MAKHSPGNNPTYMGNEPFAVSYDLTAATATTAGGVISLANPVGADLIIIDAAIDVQTAATTSANTIDLGVAAGAATSSDTLFDGQATTSGIKSPGGTNGARYRKWGAGQYITGTASATLVGMVAVLHLVCVRAG